MKTLFFKSPKIAPFLKATLITGLVLIANFSSKAADYYWVGGSGNWSDYANHWATTSGGLIFHTSIPTLNDNVYFDANSFTNSGETVVFDNTFIYCNYMDWTGVLNTPTVVGSQSTLHIYGSLILVPGLNWQVPRIDFLGVSLNSTVVTSGHPLDSVYFNGTGTYTLTDDFTATSISILDGGFNSSGFTITTDKFIAGSIGGSVDVDLSNSSIFLKDLFKVYDGTINLSSANTDLTFNQISYLWSAGKSFRNIHFQSRAEVIGSFTCDNLTADGIFHINSNATSSSAQVAYFNNNTTLDCNFTADSVFVTNSGVSLKIRTLNINDYFSSNGVCGLPNNFQPIDFLNTGTINKTSGNVVVDYNIITSINAQGGAIFTANNSVNGGGNSGWNINSALPRILYWIGGTGNWSDENNWALSSGGAGGNCIPSSIDDVIFDNNSFVALNDSVILDAVQATCHDFDWSLSTMNPVFSAIGQSSISVTGSITLSPNMDLDLYNFNLVGDNTGNTLFSAGQFFGSILINGTGEWTLADELSGNSIQVYKGTFNTSNFDLTLKSFAANGINNSIFVDLGSSTLYLSENYLAFSPDVTVNSTSANLEFYNGNGTTLYCSVADAGFNNVTVNSYGYVSGKLYCNAFVANSGLVVYDITTPHATFFKSFSGGNILADSLFLMPEVTQLSFDTIIVIDDLISFSSCEAPLSLKPYNTSQSFISKSSGNLNLDYVYLKNISAGGGAVFTATNSWDLGNNNGWSSINSPAPRNLYWVGDGGDWDDPSHWSLSSNGPAGNCPPNLSDNILFDSNSFTQAGETINISTAFNSYCNDIEFSGIPAGTILNSGSNSPIYIAGSATLVPELDPFSLSIETTGSGSGTISPGANFLYKLIINGSGTWSLNGDLDAGNLVFRGATFNSNGYSLDAGDINTGGNATINLGTSTVSLLGFYSGSSNVIIDGDSADIFMNSSFLEFRVNNGFFNSVTFTGNANTQLNFGCNRLIAQGKFINANSQITTGYAEFHDEVTLSQVFTADTLVLDNPGKLVKINQVTVNDSMIANGNPGFPIQIEGLNGNGTLTKSSGVVCLDNVLLKDIAAVGGAQFFAGLNSVDLGGNSGWVFGVCSPLTSVWPGDANYDLVADNNDILNIGLAFGYTGPVRTGASILWTAQPATDWSTQFANNANLKHADTDGNGVVNFDDTLAVAQNYGLTHPLRLMNPGAGSSPSPELYIVASPDTVLTSDTVLVDVFLGTNLNPVDSIYGIAFTVNIDTSLINSNFLSVDFTNCWMGASQVDLITFHKDLLIDGRVDFTIVRNDQSNVAGFGLLTRMGIVIVDNVGAKISTPVSLSNVTAITALEDIIPVVYTGDTIVIDTTGTVGFESIDDPDNAISIYPNPASNQIVINAAGQVFNSIQLFTSDGRKVLDESVSNPSANLTLNTSSLSKGVYLIKLISDERVIVKRFQILRQ